MAAKFEIFGLLVYYGNVFNQGTITILISDDSLFFRACGSDEFIMIELFMCLKDV